MAQNKQAKSQAPKSSSSEVKRLSKTEHEELKCAVDFLINTSTRLKVCVAGFVFGSDPLVLFNFANCKDGSEARLYDELCSMAEERRKVGAVIKLKPSQAS